MKLTTNTALVTCFLLTTISCTKENTISHSSEMANSTGKTVSFTIGQHYGGGIIFYIDSTGEHGLIADTADLRPSKWWNGVYTVTGATATRIGSGHGNTRKIVLSQGDSASLYAARRCWRYKGSGYKDWFLPSRDELNALYKQKDVVGGFVPGDAYYWSSSETSIDHVYMQRFGDGAIFSIEKYYSVNPANFVRAIRAF